MKEWEVWRDVISGGSWFHLLTVDGVKEFWYNVVLFGGSVSVAELRSDLFVSSARVLGRREVMLVGSWC